MTDTDKLVAAIFTAAMCASQKAPKNMYLETYDGFIEMIEKRNKEQEAQKAKAPARRTELNM